MATNAFSAIQAKSLHSTVREGFKYSVDLALFTDNRYTLFRSEDWPAWVVFSSSFVLLICFDNAVMHRHAKRMTLTTAFWNTMFWVLCACVFCGWLSWYRDADSAFAWMSGYMLEWTLSFDNIFVFHLIFSAYGTPDHLKHRPLYFGVVGAVVFRLILISVGEYLLHAMLFMHVVFGLFLVYSGVRAMADTDDGDGDPSQNLVVRCLERHVPFLPLYDERGAFFVCAQKGQQLVEKEEGLPLQQSPESLGKVRHRYGTMDFSASDSRGQGEWCATMLFLVVCCLEICDLIFAVDSVSAIVAQVDDLFLAYTSTVFAMLGLRSMFFIVDVLVSLFSCLKYGVAGVLIFIGIKLCLSHSYHIPASTVCVALIFFMASSVAMSLVQNGNAKSDAATETPVCKDTSPLLKNAQQSA